MDDENDVKVSSIEGSLKTCVPGPSSEVDPQQLLYELVSQEGYHVIALDPWLAWEAVFNRVNRARVQCLGPDSQPLRPINFAAVLNAAALFGLSHRRVVHLLEQMPNAPRANKYLFRHFDYPLPTPVVCTSDAVIRSASVLMILFYVHTMSIDTLVLAGGGRCRGPGVQ